MSLSILVLGALLQSSPPRPYNEERQLLDRHLTQLARPLPDGPTPADDAALLKQLATEGGLREIEVGAPIITETGPLGQSRRVLRAAATYPDTDRFFRSLQSSPRLISVESLTLRAAEFGVRVEAQLRMHHRAPRATSTARLDPAQARNRTRGAAREDAARFARDEQVALEKTIALDELRRAQTSPRLFLAETGAVFREAAAALTFGSLDGETGRFTLRGVVAGMGAADALERRLESGFFRLREFSRARKEGCFQFEGVGESFRAGPEAALPLPVDEPFRPTEPFCRQDRDNGVAAASGATLRVSGPETGGISLRAVDVDLVDVASMLESLSHEPFVVAEDVRGRVNVDFAGASIDEALKTLPVRVDRAGAVRLLRLAEGSALPPQEAEETPPAGRFSWRSKRVRGNDILSALAETETAYVALGPSGLGLVSVFAREAPIDDIRRAVLASLRLQETREEGARAVRFQERTSEIGPIAASSAGRVVFRARDLTVEEMALAGMGRSGDELMAFVYTPLGEIVALRTGDALADGVVAALDATGVLIDTSEGPIRVSLAAVRPR